MSDRTKGFLNLFLAILLAALATPLVKWLVVHGGEFGLLDPGAISYCNVLFVGNALAGALILFYTRPGKMIGEIRSCDLRARFTLISAIVVGGALVPVAMYYALQGTSVASLLLLTRVEAWPSLPWPYCSSRIE